jgi:hypothetical protein
MERKLQSFQKFVRKVREKTIPSEIILVQQTAEELALYEMSREKLRKNFDEVLWNFDRKEFEKYERYELEFVRKVIDELFKITKKDLREEISKKQVKETIMSLFLEWYPYLQFLFKSIGNSRKMRGGQSWERKIGTLFDILGIPYDKQKQINRARFDFIIPSVKAYRDNWSMCALISTKRTLRERWTEILGEVGDVRAGAIYLMTTDEGITQSMADRIGGRMIKIVVWDYVAKNFRKTPNVLGFTRFMNVELKHILDYWKDRGWF